MADGTDYAARPFTQDDCGAAVAGTAEERQSPAIACGLRYVRDDLSGL